MRSLPFTWDDDAGVMRPRYPRLAHETYENRASYILEARDEASDRSRRHFFAVVRETFVNLPEEIAENFHNEEHFRKWCLIKAGVHDAETIVCETAAQAETLSLWARKRDRHSIAVIQGRTLTIYTAKSQKASEMDKAAFQDSKTKVLAVMADLIGVTPDELTAHARAA